MKRPETRPCSHDFAGVKDDDRLKQCVHCKLVAMKGLKKNPVKALQRVQQVVGKKQLTEPGPISNAKVTAIVRITSDVYWKRVERAPEVAEYHLMLRFEDHGWVSPGTIYQTRYPDVLAVAVQHIEAPLRKLYKAVAKQLRGDRWKPPWWEA
jgi:hypothetical protein